MTTLNVISRRQSQAGSILPTTLMLGLGLMYGVAGVVNLGFNQDSLAKKTSEKIATSFTTQYLADRNYMVLGEIVTASSSAIPFPNSTYTISDPDSCLAGRDAGPGGYGPEIEDNVDASEFSLDHIFAVSSPLSDSLAVPNTTAGVNRSSIIEYKGREVIFLKLSSGATFVPDELGESPMLNVFGHFWMRINSEEILNNTSGNEGVRFRLLKHTNASAADPIELYLQYTPRVPVTPSGGTFKVFASAASSPGPISSTAASFKTFNSSGRNYLDNEWLSISFWVTKAFNQNPEIGLHISDRGLATSTPAFSGQLYDQAASSSGQITFSSSNRQVPFESGSTFTIGGPLANASGVTLTSASANQIGLRLATFRLWQSNNATSTTVAASALSAIQELIEFDARFPGAELSHASMPTLLREGGGNFRLAHYTTFDIDGDGRPSLSNSGDDWRLNVPAWQPNETLYYGYLASAANDIELEVDYISGNASTADAFVHGGPPSSINNYVIHSCDENGYLISLKQRRYLRSEDDEVILWSEE